MDPSTSHAVGRRRDRCGPKYTTSSSGLMTARGDLFDALLQAAVSREKLKPPGQRRHADSAWIREQQGEIMRLLNRYDHETAEKVRAKGRTWTGGHAVIWLVVGDWLDPEPTHDR